jgi:ribosomal protein S18 acetylase RimI-like enzyme
VVWQPGGVSSSTVIRPATAGDAGAIGELVERAYGPWLPIVGLRPAPMDADYGALVAEGDVFVVGDSEVAGVLVLRPEGDALMVENVAVDPARQGEGLGRALLDFACDQAAARGIEELRLYTHERMTSNVELYERLGWEEYDRLEQHGFARVFMRKRVDAEGSRKKRPA